jgi:hypothetical protein
MGITRNDLNILAPGANAFVVTPSDSNYFDHKTRGLYVGVTGNVAVEMAGGNVVTFIGLAGGVVHPLQVIRVLATGTTALNIVGIT